VGFPIQNAFGAATATRYMGHFDEIDLGPTIGCTEPRESVQVACRIPEARSR
jgi:hypothetical protein